MGACDRAAVQSNPAALHEPYFQYLWEIPILELLVNIFTKIGHAKRAAFLVPQAHHSMSCDTSIINADGVVCVV